MKSSIILFLLLFFQFQSHAQDPRRIDSLVGALKSVRPDTNRANLLYAISKAYWGVDGIKSIEYANQCMELSKRLKYAKGIGDAWNSIGVNHDDKGELQEALAAYQYSLEVRLKAGLKKDIGGSYGNLAILYKNLGNEPQSLDYVLKALKILEEVGDKVNIINMKQMIVYTYINQKKYKIARESMFEILKMAKEVGNDFLIAGAYQSIAGIYQSEKKYKEAIDYNFQAIKLFKEIGYESGLAPVYGNLAYVYSDLHDLKLAIEYYEKALEIYQRIDQPLNECTQLTGLASCYIDIGNMKLAKKYAEKAFSIAQKSGSIDDLSRVYNCLYQIEREAGNYKLALEHYRYFVYFKDSFSNDRNTQRIVEQRMQYDFDKKEAIAKTEQANKSALSQKEIQKQRLIKNIFIGSFIIMLLFAFVFFQQRNKISKGKKLSDELLLNILPEEVAEELKAKGVAAAKQFDEVTVMFTDFKDFTKVSEKLSPTELVEEIHTCFKAFDNIITKYNIEKIKTIGDSYMCVGGLPVKNLTHATDVVNAALEMQEFLTNYSRERTLRGKETFEMRIGIHTGTVVAGIVGVKKFAYDIWGDTVNIASRMESSGEPGKVNISATTFEHVKNAFNCVYRGKISAKNKGDIEMYFVDKK